MTTNEQLRAENEAIRKLLAVWDLPGVVHVNVGLKETRGRVVRFPLCIRMYVKQKKSRDEIAIAHQILGQRRASASSLTSIPFPYCVTHAAADWAVEQRRWRAAPKKTAWRSATCL